MTRNQRNRVARQNAPVQGTIPPRKLLQSERNRLVADTVVLPSGQGIRHGRRPGQDKGQNLWRTTSQNYMTAATIDSRWTNHGI